ncbi:MAG: hypothetical protein WAW17_16935 [Rhodococcus sp. (in: high G+C Gram-positive bacteria)]|uniref:hypothetical protein n=1 Tax=Rhodococcus sp. TaxID=1831 RepID=UPI003BAF2841
MSIDAVDGVVTERVEGSAESAVFPPSDGAFVNVDTGSAWIRGWVVVDRSGEPAPAGWADVALVPVSADVVVWHGRVTPDQVKLEAPGVQPVWWDRVAPVIAEAMRSRRDVARTREAHRAAEDAKANLQLSHAQWVDKLVESAHAWADENSLCSQFDNFMEEHDLPARSRDFDVEVDVTMRATVTVSVTARSSDDARDSVDSDAVESALRDKYSIAGYQDLDIADWTIDGVEEG